MRITRLISGSFGLRSSPSDVHAVSLDWWCLTLTHPIPLPRYFRERGCSSRPRCPSEQSACQVQYANFLNDSNLAQHMLTQKLECACLSRCLKSSHLSFTRSRLVRPCTPALSCALHLREILTCSSQYALHFSNVFRGKLRQSCLTLYIPMKSVPVVDLRHCR